MAAPGDDGNVMSVLQVEFEWSKCGGSMLVDRGQKIYISFGVDPEVALKVAKWGNSLALRLPSSVVDALALKPGDDVEIRVAESRVFEIGRARTTEDALATLRRFRGKLPEGFRFDRQDAHER
jgi:antitoxin MazE